MLAGAAEPASAAAGVVGSEPYSPSHNDISLVVILWGHHPRQASGSRPLVRVAPGGGGSGFR